MLERLSCCCQRAVLGLSVSSSLAIVILCSLLQIAQAAAKQLSTSYQLHKCRSSYNKALKSYAVPGTYAHTALWQLISCTHEQAQPTQLHGPPNHLLAVPTMRSPVDGAVGTLILVTCVSSAMLTESAGATPRTTASARPTCM